MNYEAVARSDTGIAPFRPTAARPEGDSRRIDLKELLAILARRRGWIIWTTLLFIGVALAYGLLARPLYTATAQILVDPRERHVVANDVTPTSLPADGGVAQVESQLKVVGSDNVLFRVIAKEGLASDPEFGGEGDRWSDGLARDARALFKMPAPQETPVLKALRILKRRLSVRRADKVFVIEVSASSETRDKAVRIANAVVAAYLQDQAEARADASRRAANGLTARLAELRKRVEASETKVEAFKATHNIVGAGGRLVSEQQLGEINNQLVAAQARMAEAKARYDQVRELQRTGVANASTAEALGSATITQLRAQYAQIVSQEADLKTQLGPRHPAIATIDAQARNVRRLIGVELARIAGSARNDYERAKANEVSLAHSLSGLKKEALQTGEDFVPLRELEREVDANRAVYEAFLTRAKETSEQETIDTTNARVISPATPPLSKSWPPRALLAAAGLVAGLGLGVGLALSREHLDPTVGSRARFEGSTGIPVLAIVPAGGRTGPIPVGRPIALPAMLPSGGERPKREVATISRTTKSGVSLPIRKLRGTLRHRNRGAPTRQTVLVTSSGAEATGLVALGLAQAAAQAGEHVLLIDADPAGRLTGMMDPAPKWSLADVLRDAVPLQDAIVSGPCPNVQILAGGHGQHIDPDMAGRLQACVLDKARVFDLVLIDGGGAYLEELGRVAASLADDVVIVAESGRSREQDVAEAAEFLQEDGALIRGAVILDPHAHAKRA